MKATQTVEVTNYSTQLTKRGPPGSERITSWCGGTALSWFELNIILRRRRVMIIVVSPKIAILRTVAMLPRQWPVPMRWLPIEWESLWWWSLNGLTTCGWWPAACVGAWWPVLLFQLGIKFTHIPFKYIVTDMSVILQDVVFRKKR